MNDKSGEHISMPYMCQFASCFSLIKFEFNSIQFEFKQKFEFNST